MMLFYQALQAAQQGDRPMACDLLRQVLQDDGLNEDAWLWLAELTEDPNEQLAALQTVLRINPGNKLALARLDASSYDSPHPLGESANHDRQVESHPVEWLQEAERAYREGNRDKAMDLLLSCIQADERNERAWFLLSRVVPGSDDKLIALENVLSLNPDNRDARARLEQLQRAADKPLTLGILYEEVGDLDNAINQYIQASMQANTTADRLEARRRLQLAQLKVSAPDYKPTSPGMTLARLSIGPLLLFTVLLYLQGGMSLLPIFLPLLLGGLCILLGGALLALTNTMPLLAFWYSWQQEHGLGQEEVARVGIIVLGLLLLLAPYTLLFMNAYLRLENTIANLPF